MRQFHREYRKQGSRQADKHAGTYTGRPAAKVSFDTNRRAQRAGEQQPKNDFMETQHSRWGPRPSQEILLN
jgi:hypothetical protein